MSYEDDWVDEGDFMDDTQTVLVRFHEHLHQTDRAHLVRMSPESQKKVWFPKKATESIDIKNGKIWIPLWLARKRGVKYE